MKEARIEKTPEGQVPARRRSVAARQWDYLHSPPGTEHITVGAGEEPCAILMFGSPDPKRKVEWIANETAAKYGVSVAKTTSRGTEVYGDPIPPG